MPEQESSLLHCDEVRLKLAINSTIRDNSSTKSRWKRVESTSSKLWINITGPLNVTCCSAFIYLLWCLSGDSELLTGTKRYYLSMLLEEKRVTLSTIDSQVLGRCWTAESKGGCGVCPCSFNDFDNFNDTSTGSRPRLYHQIYDIDSICNHTIYY